MGTTLYDELRHIKPGITTNYSITPPQEIRISQLAVQIADNERRRIIESYRLNGTVERIIAGEESFFNMGRPIIERCKTLEAELSESSRMKLVRKRDILGEDAREDSSQSVDYLTEQGIIDPNIFFGTSIYGIPERIRNIPQNVLQQISKHPLMFMGAGFGLPIIGLLIGGISTKGSNVGMLGGAGAGAVPLVTLGALCSIVQSSLPTQRQNFESALTYLDDEVKRLYQTPDFSV